MMRKIVTLAFALMLTAVFVVPADAQMTDDAVMMYINEGLSAGKSQNQIAKELSKKGITKEQYERLKNLSANSVKDGTSDEASGEFDRKRNVKGYVLDDTVDEEFSETVQEADEIEVFGSYIFSSRNLTFTPNFNVPTPADYRLGAGDEVIIDIWGTNETTIRQTISPDGFINIPNIGIVSLNGLTIKEADGYLRRKMNKIYPLGGDGAESDMKLTLGNIRTIQVNVVGEVKTPGTYFVSSLSSIYNALYLAGGISGVGSLREISLIRNNKTVAKVDLYDFILKGKSVSDVELQDGDIITVPTYTNMVDIEGKVKRPMRYEMKNGEKVNDIIKYSGGMTGDAYRSNLRLIRRNGVEYQVFTVDSLDFADFALKDGDQLIVEPMIDRYENKVEINGAVYRPGSYQLCDNISTVAQLVRKAEGLKGDAFTNRALLYREREDLSTEVMAINLRSILDGTSEDIKLRRNDSLHVSGIHELSDIGTIQVRGEVTSPGTFVFVENMTVEDAIMRAGGLLESASTVKIDVSRRIRERAGTEQPDSIGRLFTLTLKDGYVVEEDAGFILEPYDRVTVRRSPGYFEQTSVSVSGEVIFPGSYDMTHKSERISDLVKKAGGVNSWAYVRGARLQRLMNDDEKRLLESTLSFIDSAKDSIDVSKLNTTNSYYVGIDLSEALKNPGGDADLVLREGDELIVPEYTNTVKVSGNVMYPNTITYKENLKVKDYVEMAGGYGYHSKRNKAYIIYMNGTVKKARRMSSGVVEPGCEIVVPQKREKDSNLSEILSIATTSSSVATMMATIGSLIASFIK